MWPARSDAAEKGGRPLLGHDRDDVGVVAGRMGREGRVEGGAAIGRRAASGKNILVQGCLDRNKIV